MDDYLPKPVKPDLLLAKLRHVALARAGRSAAAALAAPFDVDALASRFAGRPAELRAALTELEQRASALLPRLDASLRREDAHELGAQLGELREALAPYASERLEHLTAELETLGGAGQFEQASAALRALEAELGVCAALAPEALARAAAGMDVPGCSPSATPRSPAAVATARPASDAPGSPGSRRAG